MCLSVEPDCLLIANASVSEHSMHAELKSHIPVPCSESKHTHEEVSVSFADLYGTAGATSAQLLDSCRPALSPLLLVLSSWEAAQHVLQGREREVQPVHVVLAEGGQPHLPEGHEGSRQDIVRIFMLDLRS